MIGLVGRLNNGFQTRIPVQIRKLLNNPQEPYVNNFCLNKYPQFSKFNTCLLSKNSSPEIIILGDSHSQHYFQSASSALNDKSVMNLGAFSCLPFSSEKHYSKNDCVKKIDSALKFITETNSIKVVILSGYWSYLSSGGFAINNQNFTQPDNLHITQSESFMKMGMKVIDAINKSGKRLILMKDIPDLDFNIQNCFDLSPFKNNTVREKCDMNYMTYLDRYEDFESLLLQLTSKYPRLEIYSPVKLFCSTTTKTCTAMNGSDPLYFNSHHLTIKGSDLVIKDMLMQYPIN